MESFSSFPPALRPKAANLAKWFPEVLAVLGAPDLEESFHQGHLQVSESSTSKTLEVILPKKEQPRSSEGAQQSPIGIHERLDRLDRLAADFESLALQLQILNTRVMCSESQSEVQSSSTTLDQGGRCSTVESRLDAATEELLKLTDMLKARDVQSAGSTGSAGSAGSGSADTQHDVRDAKIVPLKPLKMVEQAREAVRPMLSPRSARGRGGQAQQGGEQRNLGVGRTRANKADWKDKLKIEVTKVREMPEGDPKSPKGKGAPAQVWGGLKSGGASPQRASGSPSSMQARIEQKLTMMLGQPPSHRLPARRKTLPASAFDRSKIAEMAAKMPDLTES